METGSSHEPGYTMTGSSMLTKFRRMWTCQEEGPDKPVGIRCAVACFVLLLLTSASFRSHGFLFVAIRDHYNVTANDASWPISTLGMLTYFSGILVGPLSQRFSLRPVLLVGTLCSSLGFILSSFAHNTTALTFTYGVIGGFGNGAIILLVNVLMTQYFDQYRGLAFGVTAAGSTIASFIFPNLMLLLVDLWGFPWMMLYVGCILLPMVFIAYSLEDAPWISVLAAADSGGTKDKKTHSRTQMSLFFEPLLYVLLLSNAGYQWGFDAYLQTFVDLGLQTGIEKVLAVNLMSYFAVADLFGRCLLPVLCDKGWLGRDVLVSVSYFISAIYLSILPFLSYALITVATFTLGSFFGLSAIFYQSLVGEYLGTDRAKVAFGVIMFFKGVFFFPKPAFIGYFRDRIQSYVGMYVICGGLIAFCSLPWLLVIAKRKLFGTNTVEQTGDGSYQGAWCPESR